MSEASSKDFPNNVKQKIAIFADTSTKFSLRRTCKDFKFAVDKSPIHYYRLKFFWDSDRKIIKFYLDTDKNDYDYDKTLEVEVRWLRHGYSIRNLTKKWERIEENGYFIDGAVQVLGQILKTKNIDLGHFEIVFRNKFSFRKRFRAKKFLIFQKISELLRSLTTDKLLSVGKLTLESDDVGRDVLYLIPHLEPETLKEIKMKPIFSRKEARIGLSSLFADIDLSEISAFEQWKKAKVLVLTGFKWNFQYEQWQHFRRANFSFHYFKQENVDVLIDQFLGNDRMEELRIDFPGDLDRNDMQKYLKEYEQIREEENEEENDDDDDDFLLESDSDSEADCQPVDENFIRQVVNNAYKTSRHDFFKIQKNNKTLFVCFARRFVLFSKILIVPELFSDSEPEDLWPFSDLESVFDLFE